MTETTAAGFVPPNPQGPKTIGLLNIIFGAALLLMSLCMGLSAALMPSFTTAMQIPQQQMVEQAERRRAAELEALDDQEKAATTEEQKEEIRFQRRQVESRPRPAMPPGMDMMKMGFDRPPVIASMWIDVVTSLILNTAMIVAGVGLIGLQERGRRLALWVAGLKIARLAVVTGLYVLVVVPIFAQGIADMMADVMAQQAAAVGRGPAGMPNIQDLARLYGIFYSVMYLGIGGVGMIYPAITVWVLTRPRARAACRARATGPERMGT